jgi:hypothetical protein
MNASLFWLTDEQWAPIEPYCRPANLGLSGEMIGGFSSHYACAARWLSLEGLPG